MKNIAARVAVLALASALLLTGCSVTVHSEVSGDDIAAAAQGVASAARDVAHDVVGAVAADCSLTAPRQAQVDLAGATRVHVKAKSGKLDVLGQSGLTQVQAQGTACAGSDKDLERIQLQTSVSGSEVLVEVIVPDFLRNARMDLAVTVPAGIAVKVEAGSGSTTVRQVGALQLRKGSGTTTVGQITGDAKLDTGSGILLVADVQGTLRLTSGSGMVEIKDVTGDVIVADKGSGQLQIAGVQGGVRLDDIGSGSVRVQDVQGDFTVGHKGSGPLTYDRIGGKVQVK